jgi:hypothetical protein
MNDHPQWTQQAKDLLDDGARNLDAATLSRLNRARQNALAQRWKRAPRWAIPAGFASACMLLLAVAVWHGRAGAPHAHTDTTPVATSDASPSDTDALADDDDFYNDLEFYAWLDAQSQDPEG